MGQLLLKFLLFLPTVRHVKSRVTTEQREVKTESVVHSLLSLFMEQSRLSVWWAVVGRRLFICQYRGCTHRFPSFLPIPLVIYTPPPSSASVSSVLFVRLSPVTLVAPSPPPSSILEWSTDGRGPLLGDQAALAEKGKHLLG